MPVIRASATRVSEPVIRCMCGNGAATFISVHAVDRCDKEPVVGQFFCPVCALRHLEIAQEVADYGTESCVTCGLNFVTLSDIVVQICHIKTG